MDLGSKIAQRRKELGMTQAELAEKMFVTRQTVSRWEAGSAYPDVQKVAELAAILEVSCDYLLKDEIKLSNDESVESQHEQAAESLNMEIRTEIEKRPRSGITRLLEITKGKQVKLNFYEDDEDWDLLSTSCRVLGFHGNWIEVEFAANKESKRKLIPVSSILSIEILSETGNAEEAEKKNWKHRKGKIRSKDKKQG